MKRIALIILTIFLMGALLACSTVTEPEVEEVVRQDDTSNPTEDSSATMSDIIGESLLDVTDMFSNRDLEQAADLDEVVTIEIQNNDVITIDEAGVYVLSGTATDSTVIIDAGDEDKVQLVLDGMVVTNQDFPVIYVKSADKVFITTIGENQMAVTGSFKADGDNNTDAVIYSKDDLTLNGVGSLQLVSVYGNGITSKDDLKITGGNYDITSAADSLEANDSIRICGGTITITSEKDALHCENNSETAYVYISGGILQISAADDAIHSSRLVQIDGGAIYIGTCTEGIESTTIQINDGEIDIYATDDGINATALSANDVLIEVNGGTITIDMAAGDTDGFDSNGDIVINGGKINVEATSSFDANGMAVLNEGEVTVNGVVMEQIIISQRGLGTKGH